MEKHSTTEDMSTMISCLGHAVRKGFTKDFKVTPSGCLTTMDAKKTYAADEVQIVNFYRFEGASDPADNQILYVIETRDGTKGTLLDAYGPYADVAVSKFFHQVEEITKTHKTSEFPAY